MLAIAVLVLQWLVVTCNLEYPVVRHDYDASRENLGINQCYDYCNLVLVRVLAKFRSSAGFRYSLKSPIYLSSFVSPRKCKSH